MLLVDILSSFRDAAGHLRVLICTSAFGMEIDCTGIKRVHHWGPPDDIELYVQEIGQVGRDERQCTAPYLFRMLKVTLLDIAIAKNVDD